MTDVTSMADIPILSNVKFDPELIDKELIELAAEVIMELADERFSNRTHGRRSGANAGCKGPLCKKFTRDRVRELYRKKNPDPQRKRKEEDDKFEMFLLFVMEEFLELKQAS